MQWLRNWWWTPVCIRNSYQNSKCLLLAKRILYKCVYMEVMIKTKRILKNIIRVCIPNPPATREPPGKFPPGKESAGLVQFPTWNGMVPILCHGNLRNPIEHGSSRGSIWHIKQSIWWFSIFVDMFHPFPLLLQPNQIGFTLQKNDLTARVSMWQNVYSRNHPWTF